jgi:sulfur-carrier protein
MIKILFFAQLREQLKTAELSLPFIAGESVADLQQRLVVLHPEWQPYLISTKLLAAINQDYSKAHALLQSGDEVAFFPPVTGG